MFGYIFTTDKFVDSKNVYDTFDECCNAGTKFVNNYNKLVSSGSKIKELNIFVVMSLPKSACLIKADTVTNKKFQEFLAEIIETQEQDHVDCAFRVVKMDVH